jgi:hypothetical protein
MTANDPKNMNELIDQIKQNTKNKSQSISDQLRVQQMLLNDPDYEISIYDKNKGRIGSRNVHTEAVNFISDISSAITGVDKKEAFECASKYKFTKKDANFFYNMNRDFMQTYLQTGRKINIVQTENSEASIFYRPVASREKIVPGRNGNGNRSTVVSAFQKVVVRSRAPKYMKKGQ